VELDPFVYFYARLAHALTNTDRWLWFQFVDDSPKGASPNFQKGPLASEKDQYWIFYKPSGAWCLIWLTRKSG
jgi:hypothetical protein